MSQVSAAMAENMMQTPTGRHSLGWPEPQRFPRFLDKMGKMLSEDYDWSNEIAKLPMPNSSGVRRQRFDLATAHCRFLRSAGGWVKEPGWVNTQLSQSRLAVVPGYSHYSFLSSPEVPQIVDKFLDDSLTNPSGIAAAAS